MKRLCRTGPTHRILAAPAVRAAVLAFSIHFRGIWVVGGSGGIHAPEESDQSEWPEGAGAFMPLKRRAIKNGLQARRPSVNKSRARG